MEPNIDDTAQQTNFYTIGYGGLSTVADLQQIVEQTGITKIIDVRSKPNTRRFSRKLLQQTFGDMYSSRIDMGGLEFEVSQYDTWLRQAAGGLSDLQELAKNGKVLVMCAEKNPDTCHRKYFVGKWLEERGYRVKHL